MSRFYGSVCNMSEAIMPKPIGPSCYCVRKEQRSVNINIGQQKRNNWA